MGVESLQLTYCITLHYVTLRYTSLQIYDSMTVGQVQALFGQSQNRPTEQQYASGHHFKIPYTRNPPYHPISSLRETPPHDMSESPHLLKGGKPILLPAKRVRCFFFWYCFLCFFMCFPCFWGIFLSFCCMFLSVFSIFFDFVVFSFQFATNFAKFLFRRFHLFLQFYACFSLFCYYVHLFP